MPIETPIGQVNRKTGKLWAGENYGEQSQESYDKLYISGKLNPAQQAIDRATSSLARSAENDPIIGPALNFLGGAVNTLVDLTPKPIQQAAGWALDKNQEAAENIAARTGLPVSLADPTTIADVAMGGIGLAAKPSVKTALKETVQGLDTIGRGGPPTPQLATASVTPSLPPLKPNFDGANVTLTPQVMEARAKPSLTQAQWDTQRGEEIRIKRNKVEDSNVAMQNIVENNQGISKKELKTKDIGGYKTQQRRYEDGQAQVSSAESNIVVPTADNPYAFPRGEAGAKVYKQEVKIANDALGRSIEQLDLHHLIPKGMSAAIYNRARDFIEKGLIDEKYLNRLAEKFKKLTGADTGDLRSGILPMRKPYHDAMHDEMRLQPSDTFPGESMEIMKETLTSKLSKINNPKDFEILVDNLIKNDIKPLVDNAKNWENMDDAIKTISPAYTGRAKPNASLKKTKKK